jgi:hypothetical protein
MSKYGLLIGINYTNTIDQLNGCINDVNNTRIFLQSRLGYPNTNIFTLTDNTSVKPTRTNILTAIRSFVRILKSGDEAWFHYSGHGILQYDSNRDEESRRDSCICPLDYATRGVITDDVIRSELVLKVPKGAKLYVVLDACNSGTGCDLRYKYDDSSYLANINVQSSTYVPSEWNLKQTSYEFKRYIRTNGEVYCISGCQDNQQSGDIYVETEKMYGGVLTSIMLSLFRSNDLNTYKWKHLLKDICCSQKINGYEFQQTALTSGNPLNMENPVFVIPNPKITIKINPIKNNYLTIQSNKKNMNKGKGVMKKLMFM